MGLSVQYILSFECIINLINNYIVINNYNNVIIISLLIQIIYLIYNE